ncbi:Rhizopuspepsin-1 [Elsinoe australis]|uniref:Rhizopuspepsin-1 n=1 Tax=Elsinoe australis TaxID=40998 RepID=A0A2P7YIY9_9PEZI|nr:Rhizopuspepsin-1 [Elsinoe australis]
MGSFASARDTLAGMFLLILVYLSAASAASLLTAERLPNIKSTIQRRAANTTSVAEPISFAPSQYWEGNDGAWSSFPLQVGSPPQIVRVMPSTAGYNNWVVSPGGCPDWYPDTCPDQRGALYTSNQSLTWVPNSIFNLGLNQNLGYKTSGSFGFDKMTLGWQGSGGPTDDHAIIAWYLDPLYFLGIFGLKPQATNFTNLNNPQESFMQRLRSRNSIPSLSYSYTAGNRYRMSGVYGSLTLGGYDASRFVPTNVTFPLYPDASRDLLVNVQSVELRADDSSLATYSTPFSAFIDSTIPFLYLPLDACALFERTFGLTWNSTLERYLVNGSLHDRFVRENPSVTITLGPSATGGPTTVITLPYGAFDLNISYPITAIGDTQYYFPLRRGANDTQYTLGRTFLQEAYLIADYDRGNFTIAPCKWDTSISTQAIRAILSPDLAAAQAAAAASSSSSGIGAGAIAGIAIGIVLVLAVIGLLLFFRLRRKRRAAEEMEQERKLAEQEDRLNASDASAARMKLSDGSGDDVQDHYGASKNYAGEFGTDGGVHEMEHDHRKFVPELDSPDVKTGEMEGEGYFKELGGRRVTVGVSELEGATPIYELDGGLGKEGEERIKEGVVRRDSQEGRGDEEKK